MLPYRFIAYFLIISTLASSVKARDTLQPAQQKQFAQSSLCFIENKGQVSDQNGKARNDIQFKIEAGKGLTIFIGNGSLHYQWAKPIQPILNCHSERSEESAKYLGNKKDTINTSIEMYRMDVKLIGANTNAQLIKEEEQEFYERYYTVPGLCNKEGVITDLEGIVAHTYRKIIYKNIYPNIDWVVYLSSVKEKSLIGNLPERSIRYAQDDNHGEGQALKYDFIVHPGGNPKDIQLEYGGATSLKMNEDGSITASTPMGSISEQAPYTYTKENGKAVASKFVLKGNVLSFDVDNYEETLVIDPGLKWGTYFGGNDQDVGYGIDADASGNIYSSGIVRSTGNIATTGSYQTTLAGGIEDACLVKVNSAGTFLWATYYGGSGQDWGEAVVCNGSNIYLTGMTNSTSNIATSGTYQSSYTNGSNVFIAKFNSSGTRIWGTYFQGGQAVSITCDVTGNIYLTGGAANSTTLATAGAFQTSFGGAASGTNYVSSGDAFLAKFSSSGLRLWSTFYGGSNADMGTSVKCDINGNVYIAGSTVSSNNIASISSFQSTYGGGNADGFLVKFDSSGTRLWSTYYGGTDLDYASDIVVDDTSNIYLVGTTSSTNNIASTGAYQTSLSVYNDAYVVKFNASGARQWATYYGGNGYDCGTAITKTNTGYIHIAGYTNSSSGISAISSYIGGNDAFLAMLSTSGNPIWAIYYGGSNNEEIFSAENMYSTGDGIIYLTGNTNSTNNISTFGSHQSYFGGGNCDGFIAKFTDDTIVNIKTPFYDTVKCAGSLLDIIYQVSATFRSGNMFTAQLSNASGAFTNPINIGTKSSTVSDTIHCTIPANTPTGTGYRVRIIATNPVDTSLDDGVNILIINFSSFNASSNSPICFGDTLRLDADSVTTGTGYSWAGPNSFSSSLRNIIKPNAIFTDSGRYIVIATKGSCQIKDTLWVTLKPLPTKPIISSNSPICAGNSLILSTSSTNGASFGWTGPNNFASMIQNPLRNNTVLVDSGNYIVTATLNGCSSKDTAHVVINQGVDSFYSQTNSTYCSGDTLRIFSGSSLAGVTYTWTGPNSFSSSVQNVSIPNVSVSNAGNYYLLASINGCTVHDTVTVSVNPKPALPTINNNSPVCEGNSIQLTVSSLSVGVTYSWSGPNGFNSSTQNPTRNNVVLNDSGYYTVVTTLNACSNSASTHVIVKPLPAAPVPSSNSPVCEGSSIQLAVVSLSLGVTYNWTGPNGFSSSVQNPARNNVVLSDSGNYFATVTLNGCSRMDSTHVSIKPSPANLNNSSNSPVCEGSSVQLTVSSLSIGVNYSWIGPGSFSSSAQNPQRNNALLNDSGNYIVTATLNGCSKKDTTHVFVNPKPASPFAGSNSPACETDTLKLNASSTSGGVSYSWSGPGYSSTQQNPKILNASLGAAGTYTLILALNGCYDTLTTPVSINPLIASPTINISVSPNDTGCYLSNLVFNAAATNTGSSPSWLWYRNNMSFPIGSVNPLSISTLNDGDKVYCRIKTNIGCQRPDTALSSYIKLHLIALPPPVVTISVFPTSYTYGTPVIFSSNLSSSSGTNLSFQWRKNGIDIPGAITSSYSSSQLYMSDKIRLFVKSYIPCTVPDTVLSNEIGLGINNVGNMGNVEIWPNPVKDELIVEIARPDEPFGRASYLAMMREGATIRIFNIVGQEVYSSIIQKGETQIDTKNWCSGVYMVQVIDNEGNRVVKKIVKE